MIFTTSVLIILTYTFTNSQLFTQVQVLLQGAMYENDEYDLSSFHNNFTNTFFIPQKNVKIEPLGETEKLLQILQQKLNGKFIC